MDGVIIDSERHWKEAELGLFDELLPKWTKEDQQKIIGINVHETYRILANEYGLMISHQEYIRRVNGVALEVYRNKCGLLPGFLGFIEKIKKTKTPIALTSSSLHEWIDIALERFSLRPYFDVIVSAEDLNVPGKPEPDIYLHTAKQLKANPKDCVVIEDSRHGVTAAKAAGMFCVGFRNGFNDAQDLSGADIQVQGFEKLTADQLL